MLGIQICLYISVKIVWCSSGDSWVAMLHWFVGSRVSCVIIPMGVWFVMCVLIYAWMKVLVLVERRLCLCRNRVRVS